MNLSIFQLLTSTASSADAVTAVKQGDVFLNGIKDKVLAVQAYLIKHSVEFVWRLILVLIILILSKLLMSAITRFTTKSIKTIKNDPPNEQNKRKESILTLVRSTSRYVVFFVSLLVILYALGLGKLVAVTLGGAGIGALAIGFGAQSLVKDVVSGLFMMFENQYSVGDYVKFEDKLEGIIEATALRVTYIRALNGDQIILPNGTIQQVINKTNSQHQAIIDISTSYENDTRNVMNIIQQSINRFYGDHGAKLTDGTPVISGIQSLEPSAVVIRIICNCKELKNWEVERLIRLYVKEGFEAANIHFPYPHMQIVGANNNQEQQATNVQASSASGGKKQGTPKYYQAPWNNNDIDL